jgi:hypothetical protein
MNTKTRALLSCFTFALGLSAFPSVAMADVKDGNDGHTLEGTWLAKVTTPNPPPGVPATFLSMSTYTGSGAAIEENNTPQIRTVGQGEWQKVGPRSFVRAITIIGFTTGRVFANFTKVTSNIELGHDGESYTSVNNFQIYDTNGVLLVSGQNTSVAKRCGLGDSIPDCIST